MRIGVYSSTCDEDACWAPQYLAEVERLNLAFAMNFDRCSAETKRVFKSHPQCVGFTEHDRPEVEFDERHKQGAFDLLVEQGFDWSLAWDVDETFERDAPEILQDLGGLEADYVDCPWVNLWGDSEHVRVDGPFAKGHRVKFHRLDTGLKWLWTTKITNGPKCTNKPDAVCGKLDLVCLHWGLMTRELRLLHKARWDRIYTTAVGQNPYGFWSLSCDEETYPPTVVKHGYF